MVKKEKMALSSLKPKIKDNSSKKTKKRHSFLSAFFYKIFSNQKMKTSKNIKKTIKIPLFIFFIAQKALQLLHIET